MGAEGGAGSSYSMYRTWLASVSLHCGWEVECEVLRIPSTRNWAVIGEYLYRSIFPVTRINVFCGFNREAENILNGEGRSK